MSEGGTEGGRDLRREGGREEGREGGLATDECVADAANAPVLAVRCATTAGAQASSRLGGPELARPLALCCRALRRIVFPFFHHIFFSSSHLEPHFFSFPLESGRACCGSPLRVALTLDGALSWVVS